MEIMKNLFKNQVILFMRNNKINIHSKYTNINSIMNAIKKFISTKKGES